MPISKKHAKQALAFEFLKKKPFHTWFPIAEIDSAADWTSGTAYTNITKHWSDWLQREGKERAQVLPEFRRVELEQFIAQSSQKRRSYASFEPRTHDNVAIYEFLLPLTRETELRVALDELFFEDTLGQRVDEIGLDRLAEIVPRRHEEDDGPYRRRVLDEISDLFSGYSISLLSGRFRAGQIKTREDAVRAHAIGKPYLIDETTTEVKFIIPLGPEAATGSDDEEAVRSRSEQERALFEELFVKAVVRSVGGEEEVWFLGDSPLGTKLHVFAKTR
jgi:hypothetical protein